MVTKMDLVYLGIVLTTIVGLIVVAIAVYKLTRSKKDK